MTAVIEATLSWLFKNARGRDEKSFFKGPAFAEHKEPTITITSPDCGETGVTLSKEYIAEGGGKIPSLEWRTPDDIASSVKEWLLFVEDPDAPLPTPIAHGIYGGIPPTKTSVTPADFEIEDESQALLKGGFHYGKNRRSKVYIPPRPLLNHGVHRYFFEIIALSEPVNKELLSKCVSREEIAEAIKDKVLGWGLWVGSCERRWE
ncbi:PEBP-like protein [Pleurostoma richardsiae]|uniref:PEBP-like protein n=1 Tax=Pleurostoma richardsiae TaxID=41990 RepID=A0AA38S146_9PEZI|nr:PEBP-like protein [Pleurostoma richardsiae]